MRCRHHLLVLSLLAAWTACTTVPGTGRTAFNLYTDVETQMQLGAEAYPELLADEALITSGPEYEMVQRVGRRIARAAKRLFPESGAREFEWEFSLVDNDEVVNAWALPGGKCAVYTGLFQVAPDEESLAAVLGHEVGHAIAMHGTERMSQNTMLSAVLAGTSVALGDMDPQDRELALQALTGVASVGALLPFSRKHEAEADEIGIYLAADAGYDPRAALGLWQRMARLGGDRPPEWLSTHPSEASRIENLQKRMPKALRLYRQAKKRREDPDQG